MATKLRNVTVTVQVPHLPPRQVLSAPDGEYEIIDGVRHVSVFKPYDRDYGGPGPNFRYSISGYDSLRASEVDLTDMEFVGYGPRDETARFAG